jgi:hypothetical protein
MSKPTVSAAGGAVSAEGHKFRRSLLMEDKTAESMRRFLAAAKEQRYPTLFIKLLQEALADWDARPRTLH